MTPRTAAIVAAPSLAARPLLQRGGIWLVFVAVVAVGLAAAPGFGTPDNVQNLIRQAAPLAIVAIGQTIVILAGGIDLSVGALMGLVVVLTNGILQGRPEAIPIALVVASVVGLTVGLLNGTMVALTRVNPLILTFGMLSVLQGTIFVYTDRTIGSSPPEFQALAYGALGPLPIPGIVVALVTVVAIVGLRWLPVGRWLHAVGGNAEHARRAGVPTRAVTIAAFGVSGLIAAVAGLVLAARLGSGYTYAGSGYEIDSIVAVVLGGTALTGGKGGVMGTLGGVLVLATINNLLNLMGVSAYVQQVIKGAIIVGAVALAVASERRRWAA